MNAGRDCADVPAVSTREQFVALIESCKAANLPKSMDWQARESAEGMTSADALERLEDRLAWGA